MAEKRIDFTYNAAGQWDTITRYGNLTGTQLVATGTYGYDMARQLTSCGVAGSMTVAGVSPVPGVHRVYNMTVEGEHVYRVSSSGILAHNNGCGEVSKKHTPGRGHQRKSLPDKKARFQQKAANERAAAEQAYDAAKTRWENMSSDARKLLPELNPELFKR